MKHLFLTQPFLLLLAFGCDITQVKSAKTSTPYIFTSVSNTNVSNTIFPVSLNPILSSDYSFEVQNSQKGESVPHFQINPIKFKNGNYLSLRDHFSNGLIGTLSFRKEDDNILTSIAFRNIPQGLNPEKVEVRMYKNGTLIGTDLQDVATLSAGIINYPECFFDREGINEEPSRLALDDKISSFGSGGTDKPVDPFQASNSGGCDAFGYYPYNQERGHSTKLTLTTNLLQGITFLSVSSFQP